MIDNRIKYLYESPATIGENGEKLFRKGKKITVPVVATLPENFKRSIYGRYSQFIN